MRAKVLSLILVALIQFDFDAGAQKLPEANVKIINFVNQNMGKKVGRGECWDLAAEAIIQSGYEMKGTYDFGTKIDLESEQLLPGDILQFKNIRLEYEKDNVTYRETLLQHTAVVYEIKDSNEIIVADQNGAQGKKVALSTFNFDHIVTGKVIGYRPYILQP